MSEGTASMRNYNTGGWTCPNCGAWVAPGTYRTPNTVPVQSTWTYTPDYSILLERIAVALEDIAVSLRRG